MSEISSNSSVGSSPNDVQKMAKTETKDQLIFSNQHDPGDSVTIHGFKELFVFSPSIKVYKDGHFCGRVTHGKSLKVALDDDCHLKFRYFLRTGETSVKKGKDTHIFLHPKLLTGGFNALKAGDNNKEILRRKEQASHEAVRYSVLFLIILLIFMVVRLAFLH